MSELDRRLARVQLKCRFAVEHMLAGAYRSVFKGRGVEFADTRRYQAGDDVRSMDWPVTARTGQPHIKRNVEEREQVVYLLVDASASLWGADAVDDDPQHAQSVASTRAAVTEMVALLSMSALNNGDRVGLVLHSDHVEQLIPPANSRQQAQRLIEAMLTHRPASRHTDLSAACELVGHLARKRSVVFVMSDFFDQGYLSAMAGLAARHDINAVHILDHRATRVQGGGLLRIADAETGGQQVVDVAAGGAAISQHVLTCREQLTARGVQLLELPVGGDCAAALRTFFQARQHHIDAETGGSAW